MNELATETPAGAAELARLQGDFRRLKILCALLFAMAALSLYQNVTTKQDLLDVHGNLNIRDELQMPRAIIHAEELTSGLTLYDREDQDRAMFVASRQGSGLTLRDVNAAQRMILRVSEDGSEIVLADPQQRIRFRLLVDTDTARMTIYDAQGRLTFDTNAPPAAGPLVLNPPQQGAASSPQAR